MSRWIWEGMRRPPMPKWRSVRQLKKLSKKDLAERCWAAEVTADDASYAASAAWANTALLVEMLEGKRPVDTDMLRKLNEHRAHVIECRTGSCEHGYAALVRLGLETAPPGEER